MRRSIYLCLALILALCFGLCLRPTAPQQEPAASPATRSTELGMVLLDEENRVFVLAIIDDSPASHAGIMPGDTITQLNSQHLTSVLQLAEMISRRAGPMDFLLERNGAPVRIMLPLR